MTRNLTAGMLTSVALETGVDVVRLIELEHSGGTLRISTASQDIAWNSQTWTAVGGTLHIGGIQENGGDLRAEGTSVTLASVDGALLATIMGNHFRGHEVTVWRAHLSDGAIVADPYQEFTGLQLDTYRVRDTVARDGSRRATIEIETRWLSRLARLRQRNSVRTNVHSHQDMLRRGGLTGGNIADTIFTKLPTMVGRPIFWGTEAPYRNAGGHAGEEPDGDVI